LDKIVHMESLNQIPVSWQVTLATVPTDLEAQPQEMLDEIASNCSLLEDHKFVNKFSLHQLRNSYSWRAQVRWWTAHKSTRVLQQLVWDLYSSSDDDRSAALTCIAMAAQISHYQTLQYNVKNKN
jgi:hypothetical protein